MSTAIFNYLLILLAAFNFGSFIWAAFRRFRMPEQPPRGVKILSLLAILCQLTILLALLLNPLIRTLAFGAGLSLMVLSTGLFWWCLYTHGRQYLSAAYADDKPKYLVARGPYRFIRHPFYTAYMLTYLGGFVATQVWWAALATLIPIGMYVHAAHFEERKFAQSELAGPYAVYRRKTGLFWPRLRHIAR